MIIGKLRKLYARNPLRAFLFLGLPVVVMAGMFYFLSGTFLLAVEESQHLFAQVYNSQTLPLLRAAVNVDPNPSKGGGDIVIVDESSLLSEAGPSGTLADIEERPPTSDQISVYVVREGDTLSQIAVMFDVSVNTIVWGNDIKRGSSIQPGETLVILPISGIRHSVESGDTLKSIAKEYGGDLEEILEYNGLDVNTTLAVGDIVVVPDGEMAAPSGPSYASSIASGSGGSTSVSGYFIRPIGGGTRTQGLHGYNAVDLGVSYGTPIVAAATGDVIISRGAGWNGGYGAYIVIRHDNGTQTLYAHNSQNIVYSGSSVVQGQVIGYVGNSGRSTGAHLHFEVRGARNPF